MVLADYIYEKPVIDTNRLCLRPMCAADVPALKEWMPDNNHRERDRERARVRWLRSTILRCESECDPFGL